MVTKIKKIYIFILTAAIVSGLCPASRAYFENFDSDYNTDIYDVSRIADYLLIDYEKDQDGDWSPIIFHMPAESQYRDLTQYTNFRAEIQSDHSVEVLIKFADSFNESDNINTIEITDTSGEPGGWKIFEWNLHINDSGRWANVNRSDVRRMLFMVSPGKAGSGEFKARNMIFWPPPDPPAPYSKLKNLILDDFNREDHRNNLGGTLNVWPAEAEAAGTITGRYINADRDRALVRGGRGSSFEIDWKNSSGDAGVFSTLEGLNLNNYSAASFWVKRQPSTIDFEIGFKDQAGTEQKVNTDSLVTIYERDGGWEKILIPTSSFSGVSFDRMDNFSITIPAGTPAGSIYIDRLLLHQHYSTDVSTPSVPSSIRINGEGLRDGMVIPLHNYIEVTADSYSDEPGMESVRFELSRDGNVWDTVGIDYDVSDGNYNISWNSCDIAGKGPHYIRAVAQGIWGNDTPSASYSIESRKTDIVMYPNPYYPARGSGKAHFINIPEGAVLEIYTISGTLVRTLEEESVFSSGKLSWDGKNNGDRSVASGIYIYAVTVDGDKHATGKFVVIR